MDVLSISPELVNALFSFATVALAMQERIALQRSIQLLVSRAPLQISRQLTGALDELRA